VAIMRMPDLPGVPAPLRGRSSIAVRYAWVGLAVEGRDALAPILVGPAPIFGSVRTMPYADIGSIHSDPVAAMPLSDMNTLLRELTPQAIDCILDSAGPQRTDCPQIMVEIRHLGGALSDPRAGEDAFDHRGEAFSIFTVWIVGPQDGGRTAAHAAHLRAALRPWSTGGRLPNFVASSGRADIESMYSARTRSRLAGLAATYDPNVIAAAQPIRDSATSLPR
jgi:hypothetical protein